MLARASSDAGTRLRCSKSSSTVHRHTLSIPESLDPDVAQQHAIAAATTAFVRAHASQAADRAKKASSELSRTKSSASRKSLTSQGSHFPPRESSFRSLQQPQKEAQAVNMSRQSRASTVVTEKFPPFHVAPSIDRPLSAQPSVTLVENLRPSTQPKPHRVSIASNPASQQIRKARSMYYASSVQTGSPLPRAPAMYLATPPPTDVSPALEILPLPSSTRPTAISPLVSPRLPVAVAPDETVDKARDKYLQDFQYHQVKHKPSLFLAPFKKRQDKAPKKDPPPSSGVLSRSSQHTIADRTADITSSDFPPLKDKKEKRSFSGSIKNKIKKVFRRTSNNPTILPVQQIEASRDYFGNYAAHVEPPPRLPGSTGIPSPDYQTLQRIRSRTPSLEHGRPAYARSGSRSGSRGSNRSDRSSRSLHSEINTSLPTNSRVTSWSSSSINGTLTQRDIKRLTVIHEAKDSIGSDADHHTIISSPKRKPPTLLGFTAFREPMPMERLVEEASTPIDPKRVFSALMKEIDATKTAPSDTEPSQDGESDVFLSSAKKEFHLSATRELHSSGSRDFRGRTGTEKPPSLRHSDTAPAPSKNSSIRSFGRAIRSTIRTVTPFEQKEAQVPDRITSVRGVVRIPRPNTAASSSTKSEAGGQDDEEISANSINFKMHSRRSSGRPSTRDTYIDHVVTPTAEQIEQRVQRSKSRWKTPLEETHMPFFPHSVDRTFATANIASTTVSRRPSHEQTATDKSEVVNEVVVKESQYFSLPTAPKSPRPRPLFSPLSPSVYSRNTDGVSILPNDSVMSFDGSNDDDEAGSAIIITSHAVKRHVIGTPSPRRRTESARSSRDWKAWLSHEVMELENLPKEDIIIHERYGTPGGHRREFTQISEVDIATVREATEIPNSQHETMQSEVSTPRAERSLKEPAVVVGGFFEPPKSSKSPKGSLTSQASIPRPDPSPLQKKQRQSSIPSTRSSFTRPKLDNCNSGRMNDRFPFIETGRASSRNSVRLLHLSPRTPDSGSSSINSKKTPSPKVYSDFSAPDPNSKRPSKQDSNIRSKRTEISHNDKEITKENAAPPIHQRTPGTYHHGSTQSLPISHPKSALSLANGLENRVPSSLSVYATTNTDSGLKVKKSMEKVVTPRPRLRAIVKPISPGRLIMRPKSAFDLRTSNIPLGRSGSESPKRRGAAELGGMVRNTVGGLVDSEGLGRLLEGRGSVEMHREMRGPHTLAERRVLHVRASTSTLALNKEPSPGSEDRGLDAIVVAGEMMGRLGRSGSTTPGQRLAERFLRERSSVLGGSPIETELTPAFL